MKRFFKFALLIAAFIASASVGLAQAQPTPVTAALAITWIAPTVDSTGATLTAVEAPSTYQIYVSGTTTMPATPTAIVTAPSLSSTVTITTGTGETSYVAIAACNPFGCGAQSTPVPITATGNTPGAPTGIKITITLTPAS